ncbi:MAG: septum formation protein [Alteromonadaceae bacterium]|jgi:septum formation protein
MIYLASASPRRRELLSQMGIEFELLVAEADESVFVGETPDEYVLRVAKLKAHHGAQALSESGKKVRPVLAADTIVTIDDHILLKPANQQEAVATLSKLSGNTHQVKTAVAIEYKGQMYTEVVTTDVTFRALSEAEMIVYWQTGEPRDKAGSYAIQGLGGKFIQHISGSYSAVVGLPLMQTEQLLQRFELEEE